MALTVGSPQTATIVVTDLVGSTELRVRVGEERAERLRRLHDRLIAAEITARNGTVVKGLGDGVLAMFSGAADAVAASVAIQQSMVLHNRRSREAPLSVRIAISAGDVTVEDGDCFGTPVVEASRLCAHAEGGQVLVADLVRLLARGRGGHEFNPLGELELKGLPDPVATAEVLWDASAAGSIPLPAALAVGEWYPFAGRVAELERLALRWKEAAAGELRMVALAGEPGMGKTRMVTELSRDVHAEGAIVLYGRCDEELDTPYRPFAEALRHLVAHASDALLAAHLAAAGPTASSIVPELCRRIDCENALEIEPDRSRLFQAVLDLLARTAEEAPVLLVLDDLHWADRSSLQLLRHVVSDGTELPLLVVGTYRDTDLARTHPLGSVLADLRRNPIVERVSLEGLAVEEVALFLTGAAGSGEVDLPGLTRLAEILFAETEGNPFFLSEVLSHLMESRAIYQQDGRWVGDRALIAHLGVPEGVREVLGRRLSTLSDAANEALTVAAVIGQEFALPVLADVLGVDPDELVERLDEAVDRRLIEEAPQSFDTFRFAHALVRQTLCEELTTSRRVRLHRKIASSLEQRGGTVEQLAHHYGEAAVMGEEDKALTYARSAGGEAMERLAYEQAAAWFSRALEFDESLAPEPARRAELLMSWVEAMNEAGDPAEARSACVEAFELAKQTDDLPAVLRAALAYGGSTGVWLDTSDDTGLALVDAALAMHPPDDLAARVRLLMRRAHWLTLTPRAGAERSRLSEEALDLSQQVQDPLVRAAALRSLLETPQYLTPDATLLAADELGAIGVSQGSDEIIANAHMGRALAMLRANRLDELDECVGQINACAARLRSQSLRWVGSSIAANVAIVRGEFSQAERLIETERREARPLAETALIIADAHEILLGEKIGDTARVLAGYEREIQSPLMAQMWLDIPIAIHRGDMKSASASVLRWTERLRTGEIVDQFRVNITTHLGRFALECGLSDVVEEMYQALAVLPVGWLTNASMIVADYSDLLLGRLAAFLGRTDEARRHLTAALSALEDAGARPYAAEAAVELAAVAEDAATARALLARADAIADQLGLEPVQRRVDEVAAAAGLARI